MHSASTHHLFRIAISGKQAHNFDVGDDFPPLFRHHFIFIAESSAASRYFVPFSSQRESGDYTLTGSQSMRVPFRQPLTHMLASNFYADIGC